MVPRSAIRHGLTASLAALRLVALLAGLLLLASLLAPAVPEAPPPGTAPTYH